MSIRITAIADVPQPLARMLEWEYFDGERWRELQSPAIETENDQIALLGPMTIAETTVGDVTGLFIRGRLAEVPESQNDTMCDLIKMRLELTGEGERPDTVFSNIDGGLFLKVDMDRNFQPFGRDPKLDSALYLQSDRVIGHPDADVRIDLELADPSIVPGAVASPDLVLVWEYWNGKRWKLIGRNGFGDFDEEDPGYEFRDETLCMTANGHVSFKRPKDIKTVEVNSKEGFLSARASNAATTAWLAPTNWKTIAGCGKTHVRCGRRRSKRCRCVLLNKNIRLSA